MGKKGFKKPTEGANPKINGQVQSPKKLKTNGQPPQKQEKPKISSDIKIKKPKLMKAGKEKMITAEKAGKMLLETKKVMKLSEKPTIGKKTNPEVDRRAAELPAKKIVEEKLPAVVAQQAAPLKPVNGTKPTKTKITKAFSPAETAEHEEAASAKKQAKKKALHGVKKALRKKKRAEVGQYKPEVVNLTVDQVVAKIEEIRSRGSLSTSAKRKLGVLMKKKQVLEGTYVPVPASEVPRMSECTKRKLRRMNTVMKKTLGAEQTEGAPDKSEEAAKDVEPAKPAKKNVVEKSQVQKKVAPVVVKKNAVEKSQVQKNVAPAVVKKNAVEKSQVQKNVAPAVVKKNAVEKSQVQKKVAPVVVQNNKKGKQMKGKKAVIPPPKIESEEESDDDDDDSEEQEEVDSTLNTSADISMDQDEEESDDDDDSEEQDVDSTLNTSADVSMDQDEEDSNDDEEEEEEKKVAKPSKVQEKSKKPQQVQKTANSDNKPQTKGPQDVPKKTRYVLFVGNLPYDISVEDIKKQFLTKVSEVQSVRIPLKHDNSPRGFAYVEFTNSTDYEKGLSLHNSILNGRQMVVQYSEGGSKKSGKRPNVIAKNQKLHALRKQGKLAGSMKDSNKRNFRRNKKEAA